MPIKAFTDFTEFADKITKYDLVTQLSTLFTLFDVITDKNHLDKEATLDHMKESVLRVNKELGTL